jgi:hypothetical protein
MQGPAKHSSKRKSYVIAVVLLGAALWIGWGMGCVRAGLSKQDRPRRSSRQTIKIPNKGDFQRALNEARCGDTIVLEAGGTYANAFHYQLPYKGSCSGTDADYITITTSNVGGLPAVGVRLDPTVYGAAMAKLLATANQPILKTEALAHHYKFIGIEFTTNGAAYIPVIVNLGVDTTRDEREQMKGFVFDRCFIHPAEISAGQLANPSKYRTSEKGINLDIVDGWVMNSYIAGFTGYGQDNSIQASMAVLSDAGPGPLHIINNYLEAWYSSVFIGGADAAPNPAHTARISAGASVGRATLSVVTDLTVDDLIAFQLNLPPPNSTASSHQWGIGQVTSISGTTVSFIPVTASEQPFDRPPIANGLAQWKGDVLRDVEIRSNSMVKRPEWDTYAQPKNWLEVKAGRRIVIDGNRMISGTPTNIAITVWNQNGSSPWIEINDLRFTNNWLTNFKGPAFGLVLKGYSKVTGTSGNITIANNLLDGSTAADSSFLGMNGGYNVKVSHNTVMNNGSLISGASNPIANFEFTDNIVKNGNYGFSCFIPPGTLNRCWPNMIVAGNVIVDNRGDQKANGPLQAIYPGRNWYPQAEREIRFADLTRGNYRLTSDSPYRGKGTNGQDPGVNVDTLRSAIGR